EIGMSDTDRMALMGHGAIETTDRYTHEDRERMRAGNEQIIERIFAATGTDGSASARETAPSNVVSISELRKSRNSDKGLTETKK
ncbi:MAG: hypothetical protein ACM336_18580, partial [Acidobacteriota bacterium]